MCNGHRMSVRAAVDEVGMLTAYVEASRKFGLFQ